MEKESTICYIMTTFVIIFILINLGQSKWSDIDAVRADAASANPKYNNSELSDSINKNYNFEKKLVYNNTDQEVPLELTMSVYNIKILDQIVPINIFSQEDDLINNIILDKDTKSITLILNPRLMPGKLFIEIPRSILDSQSKNSDINFTAFLNDRPVEIKELVETNDSKVLLNTYNKYSKESDNRKLMIEFDKNTKVIKIHGTDIQTTNKSLSNNKFYNIPIKLNNTTGYVTFNIQGGDLEKIHVTNTSEFIGLDLFITPLNKLGKLFIEIPRSILDSQSKNSDINFTAFLNDRPVEIKELVETNDSKVLLNTYNKYSKESDNRKLMIEFDKNTKVIKIHGTDIQTTNKSLSETEGNNTIKKDANENVDLLVPLFSTLFGISIAIFYLLYRKRNIKRKFN